MIIFTDLHNVTPNEFRMVATDSETGRSHVYPVFAKAEGTALELLAAVDDVKLRVMRKGLPPHWDSAAEREAMQKEYAYPNTFRKAP